MKFKENRFAIFASWLALCFAGANYVSDDTYLKYFNFVTNGFFSRFICTILFSALFITLLIGIIGLFILIFFEDSKK